MKNRIFVFYAISALSLMLFAISPSVNSCSFYNLILILEIGHVLIVPADQLMNAKY